METICETKDGYIDTIASELYSSFCVRDFPCQDVERRNKPEIEFGQCKELLLEPHVIKLKSPPEQCLVEPSINSTRISFLFNRGDEMDDLVALALLKFLGMKADHHLLLRRTPVDSYDVSFLVTSELLQQYGPVKIMLSTLKFASSVPEFLADLKSKAKTRVQESETAYFM